MNILPVLTGLLLASLLTTCGAVTAPDESLALIRFDNGDDLNQFLENQTAVWEEELIRSGIDYSGQKALATGVTAENAADSAAPVAGTGYAQDYSTTNIQVQGVDEADFVKNDGKYIYHGSGETLTIIDAYPPEGAKIIWQEELDGRICDLFLNGDQLVVFLEKSDENWIYPQNSRVPILDGRPILEARIYSVANPADPDEERKVTVSGSYENARMAGDTVYLLSASSYEPTVDTLPVVRNGDTVVEPAIWVPGIPFHSYRMHTLTAFSLTGEALSAESFLLGYDNTLYASEKNIYIAYQPYYGWWGNIGDEQKTVIHRFGIDGPKVVYQASGTVPGTLLNQFSLDEYENHLRVATTVSSWNSGESEMYNNVYVLDRDLTTVGELTHLAPDEKIYSARFMGDLLYLVTFKQIDPLFVIDLSNPQSPGILGELKIPGYSDYLHPVGDHSLLGIGKDTETNEWGGVSASGLKIALFDITDLNNPGLIDQVILGAAGSDSAVLTDHKAFLYDPKKGIMVLPARVVEKTPNTKSSYEGSYRYSVWQGAYVYHVSPTTGFDEIGRVQHGDTIEEDWYWGSPEVTRSILMDNALYTISSEELVASLLDNPGKILQSLPLPGAGQEPVYRILAE